MFHQKKIENQRGYMSLNLSFYEKGIKYSHNHYSLVKGNFFVSGGYIIISQFCTVMVTTLCQFLLEKYTFFNTILNQSFQASKSLKCSTDLQRPPRYLLFCHKLTLPIQLPSIYVSQLSRILPFPVLAGSLRNGLLITMNFSWQHISTVVWSAR